MKKRIRYITCVIQGESHKRNNIPCQDKVYVNLFSPSRYERIGIFALADGAGSAEESHIGAEIVTKSFVDFWRGIIQDVNLVIKHKKTLVRFLNKTKVLSQIPSIKLVQVQSLYDFFTDASLLEVLMKLAFKSARDTLFEISSQKDSINTTKTSMYSSTLVGCVYYLDTKQHYSTLLCSSIGDSVAFAVGYTQDCLTKLRGSEENTYKRETFLDFDPPCEGINKCIAPNANFSVLVATRITKGEFANETVFLDNSNWTRFQSFSKIEFPLGLIMSSDGLEKVYFRYVQNEQKLWRIVLIDDFLKKLYTDFTTSVITSKRLSKILKSNEIHEINSDDKSIIIVAFPAYIKRKIKRIV